MITFLRLSCATKHRRHAVRLVACTFLGALTTVGVAWGCALEVELQSAPGESRHCAWRPSESSVTGIMSVEQWSRFGSARYACALMPPDPPWSDRYTLVPEAEVRACAPGWSRHVLIDWVDKQTEWTPDPLVVQGVDARGWPFHALWCAYAWNPGTEPDLWFWQPGGGGIQLGDGLMPVDDADWWPRAALPTLPISLGFAADTVFYAGAWMGLLAAPARARAWLRKRRGLCPGCGYSRAGLSPSNACPECGASLKR